MRFRLIFLSFLLAACSDATIFEADNISIQSVKKGILIENKTSQTIYWTAFEREILALINWAACDDPARCEGVLPGKSQTILFEKIPSYSAGKEVVVYWWNLEKQDDESYRVVNFQTAVVKP